jgi:hypothetical protein
MERHKDKELLKKFMKEFFPFRTLLKAGFFTKEMKNDYDAQAERVCIHFGFETVYEYRKYKISAHLSIAGDRKGEPFVTVLPSIYD